MVVAGLVAITSCAHSRGAAGPPVVTISIVGTNDLHGHVLPRWDADSNFMTTVAEARVLPEPLSVTWAKLRDAWER